MCQEGTICIFPEKLKSEPGKCSPEQVKACHGSTETHPCACSREEPKK